MAEPRPAVSFLIPAAGSGERLGLGSKGLLELGGRPLLCWLVDKAREVADEVLVAVSAAHVDEVAAILPGCRVIGGGASRQDSVRLLAAQAKGEFLLVHDAARPFVSIGLLRQVRDAALQHGCAGAMLDPEVPVAQLRDGWVASARPRHEVGLFQSPQAFGRGQLQQMQQAAEAQGWRTQSTLQLALLCGFAVRAVPGEKTNIKITTPDDWRMAQHFEDLLQ